MKLSIHSTRALSIAVSIAAALVASIANADTLRIVTWNVNLDTTSYADPSGATHNTQLGNIVTAIEGMGQTSLTSNGVADVQPIDVLALQELPTSPTAYLTQIVTSLNTYYGAGTYAYATTNDPTTGGTGGGPNGMIYNTKTVSFVAGTTIGGASASGAPRAPLQYTLQPVGYKSNADFYLDVSHMKSGTDSGSATRRNDEAQSLVSNLATLGSSAHVVSVGDFNITTGSSEATYKTMVSAFKDVALNEKGLTTWADTSKGARTPIANLLSESSSDLIYRDDIQFTSPSAASGSASPGLQYDAGSYSVFGNGGSTSVISTDVSNMSTNTGVFAGSGFTTAYEQSLLDALVGASDHLPVMADYDIVGLTGTAVPEPASLTFMVAGSALLLRRRRRPGTL